jgi:hypothetical protein
VTAGIASLTLTPMVLVRGERPLENIDHQS